MTNIAVFASGGGSNAHSIIQYFKHHPSIRVSMIVTNRKNAGVRNVAASHNIPSFFVPKDDFENQTYMLELLQDVQWIALAGFLKLIPSYIIHAFTNKIVNIHPSLLPKYGGHGMYGHFVHEAVFNNQDRYSGMTIHLVDEEYDRGQIIKQSQCDISDVKNAHEIASRVLRLEHYYFPRVLEALIQEKTDLSAIDHTVLSTI